MLYDHHYNEYKEICAKVVARSRVRCDEKDDCFIQTDYFNIHGVRKFWIVIFVMIF
jgi:hypothetical protein